MPVAYVATGNTSPTRWPPARRRPTAAVRSCSRCRTSLPAATATELARLRPAKIVVLGGTAVISDTVLADLRRYATSGVASRIAGADRYATAARVSAATFAPGVAVAYVATGVSFPDALAGGVAAGRQKGPVLLVSANSVPAATVRSWPG